MGEEPFFPWGESQSENKTISPSGSPVSHMGGQDRNKPLSNALCHVFTTLLVSKFSWQNQPVSRLLTKTILYFLHHLYSYLSIHFLIFFFILAMNYYFFFFFFFKDISILGANDLACCQKKMASRWIPSDVLFTSRKYFQIKIPSELLLETSWVFFIIFLFFYFLTIYKQLP